MKPPHDNPFPRPWSPLVFPFALTLLGILTQPRQLSAQTSDSNPPQVRLTHPLDEWQFLPIQPSTEEPNPKSPLEATDKLPWKSVRLPASFEQHEGVRFDGIGWYRLVLTPTVINKVIQQTNQSMQRLVIRFHGAATHSTLYCNGELVAEHLGGWTPFACDLSKFAQDSQNVEILVRVDERVGHNSQGFLPVFAPHFGGLWKPVELQSLPAICIDADSLFLWGDHHQSALHYEARLQCPKAATAPVPSEQLHLRIYYRLISRQNKTTNSTTPNSNESTPPPPVHPTPPNPWSSLSRTLSSEEIERLQTEGTLTLSGQFPMVSANLWSPESPDLYEAVLAVETTNIVDATTSPQNTKLIDQVPTRFAFRSIRVEKDQLLLNDRPIQVRGVLNWGYAPPRVAPSLDPAHWREELQLVKDYGFNLIKFCLWVPPKDYLHLADEMGVLVWMEYPTWHSQWTQEALPTLEREFDEFFLYDRNHPSVILRSLTCETGPSADIDVIRALYDQAHNRIPGSIVEDDSSWIQWNRIHDFYDDHPYGNNHTWTSTLARLNQHIDDHGVKPLVLGEAIAADTWLPPKALDPVAPQGREAELQSITRGTRENPSEAPFWFPLAYQANQLWAEQRALDMGTLAVERLESDSKRYAWLMRKYQIETYRRVFPSGGYVVSVIRDFPFASMGMIDFQNKRKWSGEEFTWHSDTALLLQTPADQRSFWEDTPFEADLLLQAPDLRSRLESLRNETDPQQSSKLRLRWSWNHPQQTPIQHERTWTIESLLKASSTDTTSSLRLVHSFHDSLPSIPRNSNSSPQPTRWNLQVELVAYPANQSGELNESSKRSDDDPSQSSSTKENKTVVIAKNNWDLWQFPIPSLRSAPRAESIETPSEYNQIEFHDSCNANLRCDVATLARHIGLTTTESSSDAATIVAQKFDTGLLEALELGRNVLFIPDGQPASLPLSQHWFLRGGPILNTNSRWEPSHEMLRDLQHFDLAGPVVPDIQWLDQCTPFLMLWDNHDIPQVKTHGLLFASRIGKGVLLVNTLNLGNGSNPAGAWVFNESIELLRLHPTKAHTPSNDPTQATPTIRAMRTETLQALRDKLREKTIDLTKSDWKFLADPKNQGLQQGWHLRDTSSQTNDEKPGTPNQPKNSSQTKEQDNSDRKNDLDWRPIQIGKHWESQGYPGLDGWAWYQTKVQIPDDWPVGPLYLWVDGADDYIEVYAQGSLIGTAGDRETRKTAFEDRVSFEIPPSVTEKSERSLNISIRVEDWQGAGGLFRPITLATTPRSPKLQIIP